MKSQPLGKEDSEPLHGSKRRDVTQAAIGDMFCTFRMRVPPMDSLEKVAYTLLGFVCAVYLIVMLAGLIAAFPWGIIGLIAIAGIGLLMIKVIRERVANTEDNYYSKNVDQ
jgi:hypothetical protein